MKAFRKSTWTIMILGASAGCAGDEPATMPDTGPVTPPAITKPPPPPTKDTMKGEMSKEMTPPATSPAAPDEGKKDDAAPKIEGPKADTAKPSASAAKLTADEVAAIKELPAAEQAAATAQAVCPVSDHHLGSMGMPIKISAEGRTFYLCCDSCEEKVKSNPKAVIAKLDKTSSAK